MSANGRAELDRQIRKVINYIIKEFDMTYGEIVGVVQGISFDMLMEAYKLNRYEEDGDEEDGDEEGEGCDNSDT